MGIHSISILGPNYITKPKLPNPFFTLAFYLGQSDFRCFGAD